VLAGFASYKNLPYRANICVPALYRNPSNDDYECDQDVNDPDGRRFVGEHKPSIFKIDEDGKMV